MDVAPFSPNIESLVESCKPMKKRGRPSHKRQILEIRDEKKINLQTSDSVIAVVNLRSILSLEALQSLPVESQQKLVRLLPNIDQIEEKDGLLKPSSTALSNEYFAKFCTHYQEKLLDNKLSEKAIEQAKLDLVKDMAKVDPWKLKHLEPIWGQKLASQTIEHEESLDC